MTRIDHPKCSECGKEIPTDERIEDFESFYEAERRIDYFEFSDPPTWPFCECNDEEDKEFEDSNSSTLNTLSN